ncbi:MAG: response regulator [Methylocella sp.]
MAAKNFDGLRVFLVEDESLIAMLLADMLTEIGGTVVGVASRLDEAIEMASSLTFDVAILDVNVNGCRTYPVAEAILRRGVPFIFGTGYEPGGLSADFQNVPVMRKPFQPSDLERALGEALASNV